MNDMNDKHNYDMKTMNDNISDMLQNSTDTSSKADKHEEQITEVSSKLSKYEDRLKKLSIKDTHIQPLSLQITKIIDISSMTDKH